MDYSTIAIWMAVLTLALLIAEFFIPSAGMLSVLATISGVISVWGAYQAWWERSPLIWWIFMVVFVASIPSALAAMVVILPRTSFGKRLMPDPPTEEEVRPFVKEREKLLDLVGSEGRTATLHTPGGITEINGRRYHSESNGLLIEPSTPVRVVGIDGNRLVVQEISGNLNSDDQTDMENTTLTDPEESTQAEEKLDFPFSEE